VLERLPIEFVVTVFLRRKDSRLRSLSGDAGKFHLVNTTGRHQLVLEDRLVAACREREQCAFAFFLAPLRLNQGAASPVNPLAVF